MTLPWLTPEEQQTWLELVNRNDKGLFSYMGGIQVGP